MYVYKGRVLRARAPRTPELISNLGSNQARGSNSANTPAQCESHARRLTPPPVAAPTMYVIKRDGRSEDVLFDKITSRIKKLCYGLDDRCGHARAARARSHASRSPPALAAPMARRTRIAPTAMGAWHATVRGRGDRGACHGMVRKGMSTRS